MASTDQTASGNAGWDNDQDVAIAFGYRLIDEPPEARVHYPQRHPGMSVREWCAQLWAGCCKGETGQHCPVHGELTCSVLMSQGHCLRSYHS